MDLSSSVAALAAVQGVGYSVMFLLMFIEGPIFSFVAAFGASLGFFNIFIVYVLAFLGNFIGDIVYYSIGRLGRRGRIKHYIDRFLTERRVERIEHLLQTHPGKTLTVIKTGLIIALPGLILAGYTHMNFRKYLLYCFLINIPWCLLFVASGYYSGAAFRVIIEYFRYAQILLPILLIVIVIFFISYKKISQKLSTKIERV